MAKDTTKTTVKRGPGRPPNPEPSTVVSARVPKSLVRCADTAAQLRGLTRQEWIAGLIRSALTAPSGGYDPQTGSY